MVEYGGAVRQAGSTGGGGSLEMGSVFDAVSDAFAKIAALPPEILLVAFAAVLLGGLIVLRRA